MKPRVFDRLGAVVASALLAACVSEGEQTAQKAARTVELAGEIRLDTKGVSCTCEHSFK